MAAKRTFLDMLASDGASPTLWIKLASGDRLPAHREVLAWSCQVVKQLPPGDTWDISGLVVEGRAVERRTVAVWLAAVYPPGEEAADEPGEPPRLADVLAFADTVGTSRPALRACCARCPLESLTVAVGDKQVALPLNGRVIAHVSSGNCLTVSNTSYTTMLVADGVTSEQARALGPQVAAQLEPLLHLAYKLQLTQLQAKLHAFVYANTVFAGEPLDDHALLEAAVFTDRVMAAADRGQLKAAWIASIIGVPCGIGSSEDGLLVSADEGAKQKLRFKAALGARFLEGSSSAALGALAHHAGAPAPGAHRVVLFPVQDDDLSERVFAWAVEHELKHGDAVHLLHVIVGPSGEDLRLDYFNQQDTSEVLAAQQPMLDRRFTRQLRDKGLALPVTIHIVQASEDSKTLARIICRRAEQLGAALVVMGRPDRSWLHRLLLGCAADSVAKACLKPVKVLRPGDLEAAAAGAAGAAQG